jgi:transcriptional regulator with XRE-family HTH domain
MRSGYNNIEKWLIPILAERGLTIEQFSYLVDLNKSTLYHYFRDIIRPSPEVMARICNVLGVPEEEGMRQYTPRTTTPKHPQATVKRRSYLR